MKKIMAAVLAAATFVSAISFSAFAADLSLDSENPFRVGGDFSVVYVYDAADGFDDVIRPEASIHVPIPSKYADTDKYTVSAKAVDGAKYVKKISRSNKNWGSDLKDKDGKVLVSAGRWETLKIELKPSYIDEEHKLRFEFTVKAKSKSNDNGTAKFTDGYLYSNNQVVGWDSYEAGQKGYVFKPVKNEENEIIWNDQIRDIARLTFIADSDVAKAYPKLNTKWDNTDYAEYFNDQDAFLFEFVSNPYISSTSRAVLEIYNPYYNVDNDEVTVDGADVVIYEVTEDGFIDVTDQFTYGENEDGDLVFTTKTRKLGTYIFAEHETTVEDDVVAPDDVTSPEKVPADTGR